MVICMLRPILPFHGAVRQPSQDAGGEDVADLVRLFRGSALAGLKRCATYARLFAAAKGSIEVVRGADEAEMGECLWEVTEGLTAWPGLLGVQPEMVGVAKHLFEDQPCLVQTLRVGATGSRSTRSSQQARRCAGPR